MKKRRYMILFAILMIIVVFFISVQREYNDKTPSTDKVETESQNSETEAAINETEAESEFRNIYEHIISHLYYLAIQTARQKV